MDKEHSHKYKFCNHHHELTENHEIVDFGDGAFVANKAAIPLLKALNDVGLRTRTHHVGLDKTGFVSVLLDNVQVEVRKVSEVSSGRTKYNEKYELLITWQSVEEAGKV